MKIRDVPFLPMGGLYESDDVEAVMRVVNAAAQPGGLHAGV